MSKRLTENIITNPEDKSFRRMVIVILTIVFGFTLSVVVFEFVPLLSDKIVLLIAAGTTFVCLIFAIRGNPRPGQILTPFIMFVALIELTVFGNGNGIFDPAVIGLVSTITLASLLQGSRGTVTFIILVVITLFTMGALDMAGLYNPVMPTGAAFGSIGVEVIITIANGSLLLVLISRLTEAALKASENEKAQIEANLELIGLKDNLEIRIKERTSALEEANAINVSRAKQFEAISQIARATTSIQNLEILLRDITKLISEQFGFYHVGVFLMDDSREFAVLMAANSEGGRKMLAHNHKLKVGQVGIVGYVTSSGNPRIALDTGTDAVHFDNPDLPDTRSELALPLQIGRQIIGALDVQSLESNAFSQDDVQILSTLADQIAIAIQNARSFEESRKLLQEAQSTVSSYMTESWQALRPIQKSLGYQFSGNSIKVLDRPIEGAHIKDALKKGVVITSGENLDNLAIPIRLRGQVIGVMNLQNPAGQAWDQDQIDIATATAERLSLAIENATLLQATQRRADIERITSNISTRISSSTRFETILKTAAEELSRALGGSDVLVQIEPVSIKMDLTT